MDGTRVHQLQALHHSQWRLDVWWERRFIFLSSPRQSCHCGKKTVLLVLNQAYVYGRSSPWPSSHSSGWKMGRWSTSWSQEFDSLSRSAVHQPCTPFSPAAGPMGPMPDPPLASSSVPWGTNKTTWYFISCISPVKSVKPVPKYPTYCVCIGRLIHLGLGHRHWWHSHWCLPVFVTVTSTGWRWIRRWEGGKRDRTISHLSHLSHLSQTTQSLPPRWPQNPNAHIQSWCTHTRAQSHIRSMERQRKTQHLF